MQRTPQLIFRSMIIWGPLLLVGLALVVVNSFFQEPEAQSPQEWIAKGEALGRDDWIRYGCKQLIVDEPLNPAYHAQLIKHIHIQDSVKEAIATYTRMALSREKPKRAIGNLCLGMLYNQSDDFLRAKLFFNRVRNRKLPFLYTGIGSAEYGLNRYKKAEKAFYAEFKYANEPDSAGAWEGLGNIYVRTDANDSLWSLWQNAHARAHLPHNPLRALAFEKGAAKDYSTLIVLKLKNRFTWSGFLAAVFVTMVWLAYLLQLHVFTSGSRRFLVFSFGLGMVMSLVTYALSDFQHFSLGLSHSGSWFSELAYHVCAVGLIEEFAKILPLLLIFKIPGAIKEPYDLILYACTAALGFAFIENGLYYDGQHLHIIHARAMTAVVGHMFQASLIAYALAWRRLRARHLPNWLVFGVGLLVASLWHGIANYFLHQGMRAAYLVQLTAGLYLWTLFINNMLNSSPYFDSRQRLSPWRLMAFLMIGLTAVLVFEYFLAAYHFGPFEATAQLQKSAVSGSFLIVLLSFMLSQFRLKEGFWRKI